MSLTVGEFLARRKRLAAHRRTAGALLCRRTLHRALVRRRAGLGAGRPPRARGRRRQRPLGRVHDRGQPRRGGAAGQSAQASARCSCCWRSATSSPWGSCCGPGAATACRMSAASSSSSSSARGERAARTCRARASAPSSRRTTSACSTAPLMHSILPGHAAFAVDTGIATAWWVKPFLQARSTPTRSIPTKPLGARALVNTRERRRDARHLPRRPPHRHRRPDEGLRRHGDDRRQGRRLDRAGAHRRARALALRLPAPLRRPSKAWFPKTTVTILPPVKLDRRSRAQGQGAPPGRGRRAAGHHGRQRRGRPPTSTRRCSRRSSRRRTRATPASPRSRIRSAASSPTAS